MASTALTKTFGSASSASDRYKFTFSTWFKRGEIGSSSDYFLFGHQSTDGSSDFAIRIDSNALRLYDYQSSSYTIQKVTSRLFRDVNAWYHIVVKIDTTQATASDRVKIYVNGTEETSFSTDTNPSQNQSIYAFSNTGQPTVVGGRYSTSLLAGYYWNGSLTHTHCCIGYAYDASTFGETDANGVWKPITAPSVTYGTNGFFLKFENSGSMGTDSSDNGNNFTVNGNLTQTIDSPSNVYCTMNPLENFFTGSTFANGNTSVTTGSSSSTYNMSTMAMSAGKWYWEMKMTSASPLGNLNFGIVNAPTEDSAQRLRGASTTNSVAATDYNYAIYANGVSTGINGEIVAQNDIVMFAFDADNNGLYIGKNGSWYNSGDPTSGASKTGAFTPGTAGLDYFPAIGDENGSAGYSVQFNFGNGYFGTTAVSSAGSNGNGSIFEYDVPTGYYALNTKNLATYG